MTTLKEVNYRGFIYILYIHEINDEFYFQTSCDGIASKGNPKHINGGWATSCEAIEDMEKAIDKFCSNTPKTYKELADAITKSLVWTDYEECYADENIIKILFEDFFITDLHLKCKQLEDAKEHIENLEKEINKLLNK
jgi:hypothetical protein